MDYKAELPVRPSYTLQTLAADRALPDERLF
jgi:hypothetical protein